MKFFREKGKTSQKVDFSRNKDKITSNAINNFLENAFFQISLDESLRFIISEISYHKSIKNDEHCRDLQNLLDKMLIISNKIILRKLRFPST